MAASDDRMPEAAADEQLIPVRHAVIAVRQGIDHLAESPEASLVVLQVGGLPTGCLVEAQRVRWRLAARVGYENSAGDILESSHPEGTVESSRQPSRHADMVGMHMRTHHTLYRPPGHRSRNQALPGRGDFRRL